MANFSHGASLYPNAKTHFAKKREQPTPLSIKIHYLCTLNEYD